MPRKYLTFRSPRGLPNSGFTLIEVALVLVLVAILASAVAFSGRGLLRGATMDDTIAQIGSLDAQARRIARRTGLPVDLHVDTDGQRLILQDAQESDSTPLGSYTIPTGYELHSAWRRSGSERLQGGAMVVRYEPDGSAATWGFAIQPADAEQPDQANAVVVLGLTGQLSVLENDEQVQDIMATALRRDAD